MPTNAQSLTPSRPAPQSSRAQQLDAYGAPVTHRGWTNPIELLMKWIADDPVKNAKTVAEIVVGPYGAYEDAGRARKSFSKGNYGEAAFDATMMGLGALPLGGAMVKGIKAARGPVYRSRLASALEDMPMDKMSGQQAASHFKKYPGGVGADELDYTGVGAMTQQPSVTKTDLLDHYNKNPLEIKDVVKADEIAGYGVTTSGDVLRRRYEMMVEGSGDYANQHLLPPSQRRRRAEEMLARINAMEKANITGPTKFGPGSEYNATLPGGEDYQEMLLTLPETKVNKAVELQDELKSITDRYGQPGDSYIDAIARAPQDVQAKWQDLIKKKRMQEAIPQAYRGGHFPEPNVLVHGRYNTRNIDGDKTLFVEEIQSDWHQAGRKRGYKTDPAIVEQMKSRKSQLLKDLTVRRGLKEGTPEYNIAAKEFDELDVKLMEIAKEGNAVPDAPYKATDKWQGLAFQRMVRHAAENGHDRIAWTPGKVQAERYDLSKQVKEVQTSKEGGHFNLHVYDKSNHKIIDEVGVPPEKIEEYVGKDLAKKIINEEGREKGFRRVYDGLDLQVGGEGMKEFYDKILVKNANKFGKKYGQKVEMKKIPAVYGKRLPPDQLRELKKKIDTGGQEVWSLKITDKMKKDILKGGVALSGTGVAASSLLAGQENYY